MENDARRQTDPLPEALVEARGIEPPRVSPSKLPALPVGPLTTV